MTEQHFFLERGFLVRIRSYGNRREWAVYQDGLPNGPWFGTGTTTGSIRDAKRAAHAALDRTLSAAENPLNDGTKAVLLGLAVAGVGAALYYVMRPTAATTTPITTSPPPVVEQPIGSSNFGA